MGKIKDRSTILTISLGIFLMLGGTGRALLSVPSQPTLTVTTYGTGVNLSWTSEENATGYTLSYAAQPYTGPDSIVSVDMGAQTSFLINLWNGAAFYVAVQAYNSAGSSGYSNIEDLKINLPSTYTNCLGQTFVLIPAGTFTMGSPSDELGRDSDETQHTVTLTQPFYMQTTEVTQTQWEAVMGSNPSGFSGCPTCPVEQISYDDALSYTKQLSLLCNDTYTYGLPTEAEWEYAARAGTTTAFYSGDIAPTTWPCDYDPNLDLIGWYCFNSHRSTHPVAGKAPNAWGLYDMSGNVSEWCQDWYGSYSSTHEYDPIGSLSGPGRVIRGGSYEDIAAYLRAGDRLFYSPQKELDRLGMRLIKLSFDYEPPHYSGK